MEVDFMGYIDKFYSSDIYYFDNKKAISKIIIQIFDSINIKHKDEDDKNILRQFYFHNGFLEDFIGLLLSQGFISLRNMIKLNEKNIGYHYERIYFDNRNSEISAWLNPITMQLKLIRDLFGDYQNMKTAFERIILTDDFFEKHERRFGELLYILSSKIHNYYSRTEFLFRFHETPIVIEVKRRFSNDQFEWAHLYHWNNVMKADQTPERGDNFIATESMLKNAFIDSINLLNKTGYLK
jgi:hypothetical protein